MTTKIPKGWREGHGGDVACPHRDCSCCPECAKRPEVLHIYGQHFWVPDEAERAAACAAMDCEVA
jgi:hypothetical protein